VSVSPTASPIGLAAWIAEKFRFWTDCAEDIGSGVAMGTLRTDISLYRFSGKLAASLRLHK
jgi:hypothetical protein